MWHLIQRKAQLVALTVYLGQVEHSENNIITCVFSTITYFYSNTFFKAL